MDDVYVQDVDDESEQLYITDSVFHEDNPILHTSTSQVKYMMQKLS